MSGPSGNFQQASNNSGVQQVSKPVVDTLPEVNGYKMGKSRRTNCRGAVCTGRNGEERGENYGNGEEGDISVIGRGFLRGCTRPSQS